MALTTWALLLQLACVASKRIHVSQQLFASRHVEPQAWERQLEPLSLKSPIPEQATDPPQSSSSPLEHFWRRRGGNQMGNNDVPWTAPSKFGVMPNWTWSNPLGEQVRHSPLVDRNSDVYITTGLRIRKFHGRTGTLLWTWESPWASDHSLSTTPEISTCPVLDGDALLALVPGPSSIAVYSLSLFTGLVNWQREHAVRQNSDANAMLAQNGTLVFAIRNELHPMDKLDGFNRKVMAVSASDGSHLWDSEVDGIIWNFSPASPGDGTLLFASACGTAYKLDFGGRLLWKGTASDGWDAPMMCSNGGGALGPDGVFYISWSYGSLTHMPGNFFAAFDGNGAQLWRKTIVFGDGGVNYPAVGRLGRDGPLAVIAVVGDQLGIGGAPAGGHLPLRSAVVALDAKTGAELWFSEEAPWPHGDAAGDDISSLIPRIFQHPNLSPVCWPDVQGVPLITGDGTVYASSSHHGILRSIRTTFEDGPTPMVTAIEESSFHPGIAFLNSPSTAPGMLVASPCWGPTFVFLSEE